MLLQSKSSFNTLGAALLSYLVFASPTALAAGKGLPAEVVTVKTQVLDKRIEAVGTLKANESIMLRPEQSGKITSVLFNEGDRVEKGKSLFSLDSSIYRAELQEAKAKVELSKTDFNRATSLLKKKVGSAQDRDSSRAQLKVDQAQEALAQARLDKMTLKAPFSGLTGLRKVSPGDYVTAGQDLVEITDLSSMKLDFRIPEIYLAELKKATVLEVLVDALPGQVIKGEVSAISPSADFKAHNIEVRATVPNPDGTLRPGLFAKVSLIVDRQETILIPEQAIIPKDGQFFVMRVIEGNIVEMLPVKMGQRRPGLVQIHEGLAAGDTLIVAGQIKLFPGMPITPIFVDGSQQKTSDTQGE